MQPILPFLSSFLSSGHVLKVQINKGPLLAHRVLKVELGFLCTALPLSALYNSSRFHEISIICFGVIFRKSFKSSNQQKASFLYMYNYSSLVVYFLSMASTTGLGFVKFPLVILELCPGQERGDRWMDRQTNGLITICLP